jgi:anti-anti-sigma factor
MLQVAITSGSLPAVRGELDLLSLPALESWLGGLGGELVNVDLCGVTFFDSCALRAFLRARERNPQLRIVNPSAAVVKVLEITALFDYLVDGREIHR